MPIAHRREIDEAEQSIEAHLLGVAEHAKRFAEKISLPLHGELTGLLHDLGKYSCEFQNYLKSAVGLLSPDEDDFVDAQGKRGKIDHSTAGAQWAWRELSKRGLLGNITAQLTSLCICSHHSGLIDCIGASDNRFGEDLFGKRMGKAEEKTHYEEALKKIDQQILTRLQHLIKSTNLLDELKLAIAKIIKAQPDQNDQSVTTRFQLGLLIRFLFSSLIDADRLDTADFEKPHFASKRQYGQYENWDVLISRLEEYLACLPATHPIDPLRHDISLHCLQAAFRDKGIYTLTVPTGGGKTLASLRFALHHAKKHRLERIIYVIPFTSIIDQNADVVREILEPDFASERRGSIVLEHHSNLTPEQQGWREKVLSENWDAPVVYTTMVQLLDALFGSGTRGARRMHQLANSVLIFDEVQTLPVRCIHLFNNAMNFLVEQCGSTALLCTATQPLLNRVDPKLGAIRLSSESPEIMPNVHHLFDELNRVDVKYKRKPGGWRMEEIARLAVDETFRANSCLVIANTKNAAKKIFQLSHEMADSLLIIHLSTNMCPAHRRTEIDRIRQHLDSNERILCVSTQLIEAGVDVDFGAVIRFAAGLDSIAQAAGRCNRNGGKEKGIVHIINPQDENLDPLKDILIGRNNTLRVLDDFDSMPEKFRKSIIGPEAMHWYYENYFFARKNEMSYLVSHHRIGHDDDLLNLLANNSLSVTEYKNLNQTAPNVLFRQAFMTAARIFQAIDAPTQGVIVPYGDAGRDLIVQLCATYDVDKQYNLLKQAQQFSVNVFPNILKRLINSKAVHPVQEGTGILYLEERYYSQTFGLSEEPIEEWRFMNA